MSDYTPFKMKGNPMQRNFGIGSPVKQDETRFAKKEATKKNWPPHESNPPPKTNTYADSQESETPKPTKKTKSVIPTRTAKSESKKSVSTTYTGPKLPTKGHPVTPPTAEQSTKQKGTLKSDNVTVGDVAQSVLLPGTNKKVNKELVKKGGEVVENVKRGVANVNKGVARGAKKVWDRVKKVWNTEV